MKEVEFAMRYPRPAEQLRIGAQPHLAFMHLDHPHRGVHLIAVVENILLESPPTIVFKFETDDIVQARWVAEGLERSLLDDKWGLYVMMTDYSAPMEQTFPYHHWATVYAPEPYLLKPLSVEEPGLDLIDPALEPDFDYRDSSLDYVIRWKTTLLC